MSSDKRPQLIQTTQEKMDIPPAKATKRPRSFLKPKPAKVVTTKKTPKPELKLIKSEIKPQSTQNQSDELKRALERMTILNDVTIMFSKTLDLKELLKTVMDRVTHHLKAQAGSVWLLEEKTKDIVCYVAGGPTAQSIINARLKPGVGILGWCIDKAQSTIVYDTTKDARFAKDVDKKTGFATKSMITVPFVAKGETMGAIQILNKMDGNNAGHFDDDDLNLLETIAISASVSIKNAKLFESERKVKELSTILEISKEITSTLDIDRVLITIVNLSSQLINYDKAAISLLERFEYAMAAVSGEELLNKQDEKIIELTKVHAKLAEIGGAQGKDFYVPNLEEFEKSQGGISALIEYMKRFKLGSFWAKVLKDEEGIVGVVSFESKESAFITQTQFQPLSILSNQITVAVRNARLYSDIPVSGILARIKTKTQDMTVEQKKKLAKYAVAFAAFIIVINFIKIENRIPAELEIKPIQISLYSLSDSKVEEVLVKEGDEVKKGDILVKLRTDDLLIQIKQKESTISKLDGEIAKARAEQKTADYIIKEKEKEANQAELSALNEKLDASILRSPVNGKVVSDNLSELMGKPVKFGTELVKVTDTTYVDAEMKVSENDIADVEYTNGFFFKVGAYALHTFDSENLKIDRINPIAEAGADASMPIYKVKARIQNPSEHALKPGMTGKAKIRGGKKSIAAIYFKKFIDSVRMKLFI